MKLIRTNDGFTDLKASFGSAYRIFPEDWKNHKKKAHVYFLEMGIPREEWVYYWEIVGKYGKIYPYGKDGSLAVEINSRQHNELAGRLDCLRLMLDCCAESTYRFEPENLEKVAKVIQARKRKRMSLEQKEKLRTVLFEARKTAHSGPRINFEYENAPK